VTSNSSAACYLDIVGRIPTREEALELINDTSVSKRAKLIDKLLASDGANSHLFNYIADMLRIANTSTAARGRFYTYQEWLKGRLKENVGWNKIVYDMLTADGKLLDNGATGYLIRDAGMRLAQPVPHAQHLPRRERVLRAVP